jgi:Tol biopolymer transport system component
MRLRSIVVVMAVTGCGKVADNNKLPDAPVQQDSAIADGPDIDAPDIDAPPPRCDPAKPFGTPVAVTELNSGSDEVTPYLSEDERVITFASSRTGGLGQTDAYTASRAAPTGPFGTVTAVPGVNTATYENRPMITNDGLRMYFETNTTGQAADWNNSVATRGSTSANFGGWTAIPQINTNTTDSAPYILPDDSAIYFMSTRGTGGAQELWRSAHQGGNWTTPALVPGTDLNDSSFDYPVVTPNELVLYFSSSRAGGAGGRDIWMATRNSTAVAFGAPINIAALNTASPESTGWVSADNCVIYFVRNIGAAASNWQIMRAEKPL